MAQNCPCFIVLFLLFLLLLFFLLPGTAVSPGAEEEKQRRRKKRKSLPCSQGQPLREASGAGPAGQGAVSQRKGPKNGP